MIQFRDMLKIPLLLIIVGGIIIILHIALGLKIYTIVKYLIFIMLGYIFVS